MRNNIIKSILSPTLCLVASLPMLFWGLIAPNAPLAGTSWNGSTSTDFTVNTNWTGTYSSSAALVITPVLP